MERAMNIREQQRKLIEDRQKGKTTGGAGPAASGIGIGGEREIGMGMGSSRQEEGNVFGRPTKTPMTSRRKGPPPGLSIAAPAPEQFANERVIQSAPLHASFPRHHMGHLSRGGGQAPSSLANPSHIHHVHANQTQNRLPPIADVFAEVGQTPTAGGPPTATRRPSPPLRTGSNQPPLPSPSYPPHTAQFPPSHPLYASHAHSQHTLTSRPRDRDREREHKSAEEALKELTGGREDLLPRLVHYSGGHNGQTHPTQPPTPPSPKNAGLGMAGLGLSAPAGVDLHRSGSSRRRDRDEYERDNGSPPLGRQPVRMNSSGGASASGGVGGRDGVRMGAFGEVRDSPATEARKKEEFLMLVSRAWDLWHS